LIIVGIRIISFSVYYISVPAKAVELYLDMRRLLEEHVKVSANIV
jgi:hypothetical protein